MLEKEWEENLPHACQEWTTTAIYLQTLVLKKDRWGALWRLKPFTLGMEALSVVEGYFYGFKRALGGEPALFVDVVQKHVKQDKQKLGQERSDFINSQFWAHVVALQATRSDAANECATIFQTKSQLFLHLANHEQKITKRKKISIAVGATKLAALSSATPVTPILLCLHCTKCLQAMLKIRTSRLGPE